MHTTRSLPILPRAPLAALALTTLAGIGSAQQDQWRSSFTPYAWATDVGVDVALDGRSVASETIPVEDLLEDLDLTLQGRFEAQRGEHGFLLDLFYVSMSDDVGAFALPQGAGTGELDWQLDMTVADLAGTFDPAGDGRGLSFLYGARIVDQRSEIDAEFTTTSGTTQEHYEASETLVDALVGLRYRAELSARLTFESELSASTGGTESTWSVFPSLRYAFGSGRCALVAGYRHLEVDFADQGGLESELSLSGPLFGLNVSL